MESNIEFGDKVEVHKGQEIFIGVYLPSPENGTFLLKLDSGYNIGFIKKEITLKLIEKKKDESPLFELVQDGAKKTIGLVVLGGTIAARLNPGKGGVDFVESPEDLFKYYPEVFERVNVKVEVPFMKGSEDMDFKDWQKVAKVVTKLVNQKDISGVVVTQGTDTLHFTASALSFFLRDLHKPVAITYSQRSIDRASSDASLNLECSTIVATSDIAEVMTVGHADSNDEFCYAINGTKVRKLHSSRRDAFRAVNTKPFAKISKDGIEKMNDYNIRDDSGKTICDNKFSDKVALLKFYPGQNPDILDYYLEKGYKGLVIEMPGLGQVATSGARLSWTKKLKEVVDKGMVVCAAAQTINGRLNPLVYVTGRELVKTGVIYLDDMLSETAFVKLSWVLGHEGWDVKEHMLKNYSREFNPRLLD